jgi:hypothetical protein
VVRLFKIARRFRSFTISRDQQPVGGETPGVAGAPVALAGAIIPGFARFMLTLSRHAAEFGVGTTAEAGSMLAPPRSATTG